MTTTNQLFARSLIAAALFSSTHAFAATISVAVDVQQQDNGNVTATLQFKNQTNKTQKLLSWYADLEEEHIFSIKRDGEEVAFFGPHFKRHAPTDKDFIKLKAGETLTKSFELTGLYDFSQPGNYEVSYAVQSLDLFGRHTLKPIDNTSAIKSDMTQTSSLSSQSVSIWFEGIGNKASGKHIDVNAAKGGTSGSEDCIGGTCFTGRCDNGQKNDILSALNAADQIANDSVSYLNSHSASSAGARYNTWFGANNSTRYNTVSANFDAINDAIDNKPLTFDCSCKKTYFAYVYPTQPYKVYLCRAFWSANELGTDSRAGTIIHELSHFNAVAGTDDIVYGQSGAKNLAISNPAQAIQNADSHEYFAENTPNLD